MNEAERCPKCGSRLTAGSAEGLCPRCLLTAALRPPAETAPENLPEPGCRIGSYAFCHRSAFPDSAGWRFTHHICARADHAAGETVGPVTFFSFSFTP